MKQSLENLIKSHKFDYVNEDITEDNFPFQENDSKPKEYKIFHFNKLIESEKVIAEMKKEGYEPATLRDLLNWKDWNEKDFVVALGSVWQDRDGYRIVPYLRRYGSERVLDLSWLEYDWSGIYRFAAVRKLASDRGENKMTPLKTMKDFDKEFDKEFSGLMIVGNDECIASINHIKSFFHSQIQLLINEFKECLPTETYFTIGKNAKIYCDGFNSCREQTLKNLEDLLNGKS